MSSKGLGRENLPESIDLSRIPRATNKKSMISGIFGKSFISGIPGSHNYLRNLEIRTNLGNSGQYRNCSPQKHFPPRSFSPICFPPRPFFVSGSIFSGESFCFQKVLLAEVSQKSLICPEFRDSLTRNQGFLEYLENPSFL